MPSSLSAYSALAEEYRRVQGQNPSTDIKVAIERKSVKRIIRDILSLKVKESMGIAECDYELFEQVVCLMTYKSRNWISELQIALPFADLSGKRIPKDAELKSRVDYDRHIDLRNYYLKLLYICIPDDEKEKFSNFISLEDTRVTNKSKSSIGSEVLEAVGAWSTLEKCKNAILLFEKESRLPTQEGEPRIFSVEEVRHRHEVQIATFNDKVEKRYWREASEPALTDGGSLFGKLLVNAALNRYILETWAFENRSKQSLPSQIQLFTELELTIPNGLAEYCEKYKQDGRINYKDLTLDAIRISCVDNKKRFTEKVWEKIQLQAEAIINSAALPEFSEERYFIDMIQKKPDLVKCLTWIILAWCYLHRKKIINDDRTIHSRTRLILSTRSNLISQGQAMVSLRRVLSTLMFSNPWGSISSERILLREAYWSKVRMAICRSLIQDFKAASIGQWNKVLNSFEVNESS